MKKLLASGVAGLLALASPAAAQMELGGSPAGINAALIKLFGDAKAFSAKSDVRVLDKNQNETISTPMDFALLNGQIRVEVDLNQVKNKDMPAEAVASMKKLGMDRIISIIRPDKKTGYVVFPGIQSYVNMPLPKEDLNMYEQNPKIEKTALGKETLDGHPCVKSKVVLTDHKGQKHTATVWYASDMKDFPVQMQTVENEDMVILRHRKVQLTKPDAKQFEAPAGFKSHDDMQSLMQSVMLKAMGNGGIRP